MSFANTVNDDMYGDSMFLGGMGRSMLQKTMMGESQFYAFEQFFLPKTIKELFRFCAYTYMTNDAVNPAIEKLAEYPITDFTYSPIIHSAKDTPEYTDEYKSKEAVTTAWENLFDNHLMAKGFAIKISSNYYVYGNAFVSVYQPFDRILICGNPKCREHYPIGTLKHGKDWEWERAKLNFVIKKCHKCGFKGAAKVKDEISNDARRVNLISYYPGNIDIDYDPYSGAKEFYYTVPEDEVDKIKKGNELRLRHTPWDIIEAIRLSGNSKKNPPKIKLRKDNIFHLKRDSIDMPGSESPWGMPIIVSVLRNVYYLNMMKRAQTALMMDHILPFRFMYPLNDNGANTMMPMDLGDWRKRMERELRKWKRDPLYVMLTPVPVGKDQMGGDGKALMLFPEMQMVKEDIINGLNVPLEFIKGGLQYTGTSVSLRMLENMLLGQVAQVVKCFKWIAKRVSRITGMEYVEVNLRKFKMADDIQMRQLFFQMWQTQAISGETLGNVMDFDYMTEMRKRSAENIETAVSQAKAQAEAANRMMVLQSLLQSTLSPEMMVTQPSIDPNMVEQVYQGLGGMKDPMQQEYMVQQIAGQNPELARELQTRASTDMNNYGQTMQTMLAMAPPERLNFMQQMQQQNPVMALIMANLMKTFNLEGVLDQGGMGGGGSAPPSGAGGPPGKGKDGKGGKDDKGKGGDIEKSMPNQRPPTRQGGSPM